MMGMFLPKHGRIRAILLTCAILAMSVLPVHADESVTVSWAAPTEGGPVEWYELEGNLDGSISVVYAGELPSWSSTIAEGEWAFRVRAVNRAGAGPWSAWSDTELIMSPPGGCGIPVVEVN